jgi:UDP-glucuronate 4-epimerase
MTELFEQERPQRVIHLAAQAGVRDSITNPYPYIDSNLNGFINILEGCRTHHIEHLVYASSSSVYGANRDLPFSEHQNTDHPLNLYAATKKANELMAHSYSHLFHLPTTGLRFFTVYGPWGRPDMAPFLFVKDIIEGRPINVYNNGQMIRDFTYIDDIVEGIILCMEKPASVTSDFDALNPDPATSSAPYRVFNIGNNQPVLLMDYINAIESALGMKAQKNYMPLQQGDMIATRAEMQELEKWVGFKSNTSLTTGVQKFVHWYLEYHGYDPT